MVDGSRKERELVRELYAKQSWVAMRAPSSGSATAHDLPDVLAGNGQRFLVIELKASSGNPVYIDREEIEALRRFATAFGGERGEALVGCRWQSRGIQDQSFYLSPPDLLHRTDAGSYRAKYEDMAGWWTLAQTLARNEPLG
jgi:Holliday junction resolvase